MGSSWDAYYDELEEERIRKLTKKVSEPLPPVKQPLHLPYILGQLEILHRIATRGRNHCFKVKDSRGIDSFQHFEDEMERLELYIKEYM